MKMRFLTTTQVAICFPCLVFSVSPDISAGRLHVLVLKENGEAWAWDISNEEPPRKSRRRYSPGIPIKVSHPMGRIGIQVAEGETHSFVLLDDGTLFSVERDIQEYQNGTIPVLPFRSGITFVPDFSKENRIANTILANSTRSVDPEVTVARPCEGGAF